jgi:DNA/RNA-binding domain of Phe-tRNA-synthetase-like protein
MSDRLIVAATDAWHTAIPGAVAGVLMMTNLAIDPSRTLDDARKDLLASLRARFGNMARAELRATPPLPAYGAYYRKFKQTYHVLLQCESVALKGKPLPQRPPLVDAMFLAELDSLLLTAGHDLDRVAPPVTVDVAGPDDEYTGIGGKAETCRAGDMVMRDQRGVICSVIQGPDRRTRLTPDTREAMFVVYAPPGIGNAPVRRHLTRIAANVQIVAPAAEISTLTTIEARSSRS